MPSALAETWKPGMREPEMWRRRGVCSQPTEDPEMWSTPVARQRRAAMHRCLEHCPVLAECEAFVTPSSGVVVAGVAHGERSGKPLKVDRRLPDERCPRCVGVDTPGGVR